MMDKTDKLMFAYNNLFKEVFNLEDNHFVTPSGLYRGSPAGERQWVRGLTEFELGLLEKLDDIFMSVLVFRTYYNKGEQHD